jgi:hypothetical protein
VALQDSEGLWLEVESYEVDGKEAVSVMTSPLQVTHFHVEILGAMVHYDLGGF